MNKDVVYIDTEDDITAIIGKIKESKEKIVALVPPKRIGVLQSAVNLRLLSKMASKNNKRLVIVTNNKALINLSSMAKIPIAKSLQSKPEMAKIDALEIDDGEDVIDGEQLPIGEILKTGDEIVNIETRSTKSESVDEIIDEINIEDEKPSHVSNKKPDNSSDIKIKVPDFNKFRKILFLSILGIICISGFLVWAIIFAPSAEIVITAKTSTKQIKLDDVKFDEKTDVEKNTVKISKKELKNDLSVTFEATGEENIGERATGVISVYNCDIAFSIEAGTVFKASTGQTYTNTIPVSVVGLTGSPSVCRLLPGHPGSGMQEIAVVATAPGEDYNIGETNYVITGVNGDVFVYGGIISGGTTKISKVVSKDDIEKATEALKKLSTDSYKQQLVKQFVNKELTIPDSFNVKYGDFVSSPALGEEATDKAILKSASIFSISAIERQEIEMLLDYKLNKQILSDTIKIFDNGIDSVSVFGYLSNEQGVTVDILTKTAKVGPNINETKLKEQLKGKKFGDAQLILDSIPDVDDVKINFSYFWVTAMPNDIEKIDINFILEDA